MTDFDFSPPPDTKNITGFRVLEIDYDRVARIAEIENKAIKSIVKGLMLYGLNEFIANHPGYFDDKTSKALKQIKKDIELE